MRRNIYHFITDKHYFQGRGSQAVNKTELNRRKEQGYNLENLRAKSEVELT